MMLTIVPTAERAKLTLWDYIGDPDRSGMPDEFEEDEDGVWTGYSKRELRVIQGTNVKLARMLSKSKLKFRIFFVLDTDAADYLSEYSEGCINYSQLKMDLLRYKLNVPKKGADSINVVLRGMGTAFKERENLPPTPWIVIHWIAHGVMKDDNDNSRYYTEIQNDVNDLLYAMYGIEPHKRLGPEYATEFFKHIFTFRSARKRLIRNIPEGAHDAMVEYITRGDIRYKKPPPKLGKYDLLLADNDLDFYMERFYD